MTLPSALHGLNALAQDGLVRLSAERIEVTELGRFFLRNIAMCFDAYLAAAGQEKPRYSRTILGSQIGFFLQATFQG